MNPDDVYTSNVYTKPALPQGEFATCAEARANAERRAQKAANKTDVPVRWIVHHLVSGQKPSLEQQGVCRPQEDEDVPSPASGGSRQ